MAAANPLPERPTAPEPDLLTYDEAAEVADVSPVTISRAIRDGILHPVKFPRSARKWLRRAEVEAYARGELRGTGSISPRQAAGATETAYPGIAGAVPAEAVLRLARDTIEGGRESIKSQIIDGQAIQITREQTILATLLGRQDVLDPKRSAPASSI